MSDEPEEPVRNRTWADRFVQAAPVVGMFAAMDYWDRGGGLVWHIVSATLAFVIATLTVLVICAVVEIRQERRRKRGAPPGRLSKSVTRLLTYLTRLRVRCAAIVKRVFDWLPPRNIG